MGKGWVVVVGIGKKNPMPQHLNIKLAHVKDLPAELWQGCGQGRDACCGRTRTLCHLPHMLARCGFVCAIDGPARWHFLMVSTSFLLQLSFSHFFYDSTARPGPATDWLLWNVAFVFFFYKFLFLALKVVTRDVCALIIELKYLPCLPAYWHALPAFPLCSLPPGHSCSSWAQTFANLKQIKYVIIKYQFVIFLLICVSEDCRQSEMPTKWNS